MTVAALLQEASSRLRAAGVERPRWTAEQIAASVVGCDPVAFVVEPPGLRPEDVEGVWDRVARRTQGVPLQHLTGVAGFFGAEIAVRPGVFIPRPETERLVEVAVQELGRFLAGRPTVWDVGTGSGAVAISLTRAASIGTMIGFDISEPALGLARENARHLGLAAQIQWVRADGLTACLAAAADLIVANLPYIPSAALPLLPREVQWDPPAALDGGPDGLRVIRRVLGDAAACVRPHGAVALEVGAGQAAQLRGEFAAAWKEIAIIRDDTGIERVVVCRRPRHG